MSKSFVEEMSQVDVSNNSLGEPEPQKSTEDKSSREEKTLVHNKDMSSGEPWSHASTTNESPEEEKSQGDTSIKAFGEDEPHVNATVNSLGDPETQMGITGKSGEQESQTSPTDHSGDLQSQATTLDLSSRNEKTDLSNTDEPSVKEESHVSNTDETSGEEVLQTSTTDHSGDLQSQATTLDLSSRNEKTNLSNTDEPSVKEESHVSNTDETSGDEVLQTSPTEHSGDLQSQSTTLDLSSRKEKSNLSNMDEPSVKEESLKVNTDELRQRRVAHTDHHRSPAGKPEFQMDITDKSELQSQERTAEFLKKEKSQVNVTGKASGASTKYRSAGEPESLGRIVDTRSQKYTFVEQAFVHPDGTRQRHLDTNDQESQTGKLTTGYRWLIGGFIVLALAVALVHTLLSSEGKPPVDHEPVLNIFFKEFASLKTDFPGQYEGLWLRSEKLLQMHLNLSDPSAPLILMLTAAQDGERTLRCMSKRLAKSYADSLRANSLMVNGPSMSKYDSATGKLQIDDQLSSGFQSNSRAAVLHRLEMLPSGSLLILYKYCDHENAAFKKVALVITVLLKEESLETDLSLTDVEEKVKDLLWAQFASSEVSAHNEMDVDKLSGVWSRISHVVLPVLPVGSIESGSCPGIRD